MAWKKDLHCFRTAFYVILTIAGTVVGKIDTLGLTAECAETHAEE